MKLKRLRGIQGKIVQVLSLICIWGSLLVSLLPLHAGTDSVRIPRLNDDVKATAVTGADWTVEVGTGASFSNVRDQDRDRYTLLMSDLCFSYALDEVSLKDWRRGYTEWVVQANANAVLHGPENHLFGINFGPRYNFVQENWPVIPFLGVEIGAVFADSQGFRMKNSRGLGQDFTFMFQPETGIKIPLGSTFYTRLTCHYTHYSNGGLSEDNHRANNDIDAIGFRVAFGSAF
jgi:hypothetical protein